MGNIYIYRPGRTITWAVRQQYEPEIWVNNDIPISFSRWPDAASVRERHFSLPSKAAKDGNNMLRRFVRFIDDNYAAICDGSKKRRISIIDYSTLKRSCKHKLVNRRVSVELNIFSRPAQKLRSVRTYCERKIISTPYLAKSKYEGLRE